MVARRIGDGEIELAVGIEVGGRDRDRPDAEARGHRGLQRRSGRGRQGVAGEIADRVVVGEVDPDGAVADGADGDGVGRAGAGDLRDGADDRSRGRQLEVGCVDAGDRLAERDGVRERVCVRRRAGRRGPRDRLDLRIDPVDGPGISRRDPDVAGVVDGPDLERMRAGREIVERHRIRHGREGSAVEARFEVVDPRRDAG